MMKRRAAAFCLAGALALGTCTVSAASGTRNISATFRNIKIVVDGKELSTSAEPFIYNGTTYLPIRAVGEAVGKEVAWDGSTNTVYLGEVPAGAGQAQESAQQAQAGSFPLFSRYAERLGEETDAMQHYDDAILIVDVYLYMMDEYAGDAQEAKAMYDEAQASIARFANQPGYADAKALLENEFQSRR